ncbi:MAG: FUSC family protein [Solirubrobacterales bacterium]|nr:FUSC family protein [Solirubrobacterales bacterium]
MTAIAQLKRPLTATAGGVPWLPVWSVPAAMRAVRATIVVAGVFAFADQVVGNRQMATFAAFGGFATLVLVTFAGTRRDKLAAHAALAVAGSVLLTIGTAVNSSTALAAIVTVPLAFAVFFAGVAGPNAAAGVTGALLAYVLPAASPGTISMIPDRLAGWWLASVAGTAAVLLFSPRPGGSQLRAGASNLASALADQLEAALRGEASDEHLAALIAAKEDLVARFTSTPYRPTGLTARDQALANGVESLEWCTALVADAVRERADLRDAAPADRALLAAASAALRDVASLFAGGDARPDMERLERCRVDAAAWLRRLTPEREDFSEAARASFHAHMIALAVIFIAANGLVASGLADPEWLAALRLRWFQGRAVLPPPRRRATSLAAIVMRDTSLRSVWFVNSLRGALALAAAVAIADLTSVQHAFWVVLGTLSVLRTNASATGATALRAVVGTAIGFVVGGSLLLAIGSSTTALWVVLPIAVFVAAYAPGTAPFAVGQAAFTVTVAVLFNLLVPVGWKVGVVRIEDVALGCGVSIAVGLLFWPRGAASVVGDDLADAFRRGASYLSQAVGWAIGTRPTEPDQAVQTLRAGLRLDDALRAFLSEQGTKHIEKKDLWRLVGASMRLRFTAHAVAGLPGDATGDTPARVALGNRVQTLAAWYEQLAELVGKPHGRPVTALEPPSFADDDIVDGSSGSRYGIWLCEHLDHLREHLGELVGPAMQVAEIRRRPWWR